MKQLQLRPLRPLRSLAARVQRAPHLIKLTALAAVCAWHSPALAQAVVQAAPETQLKETRVEGTRVRPGSQTDSTNTGSKTDTPLRDLPASVVVIPKEVLRDQSVVTMNQAMTNVSGVQPQLGGS